MIGIRVASRHIYYARLSRFHEAVLTRLHREYRVAEVIHKKIGIVGAVGSISRGGVLCLALAIEGNSQRDRWCGKGWPLKQTPMQLPSKAVKETLFRGDWREAVKNVFLRKAAV